MKNSGKGSRNAATDEAAKRGAKNAAGAPFRISERDRNAAFALLAIVALAAAAYVLFLSEPYDPPSSDGREFYAGLTSASRVGLLYDVRGADDAQASAIYQCGVDMISKGRFVGKSQQILACDNSGCISSSPDTNGTNRLTFEQAKKKASQMPYILIKPGQSGYAFFQRHMEIYIGKGAEGNATCDIAATEE